MEVTLSGSGGKLREGVAKALIAAALMAMAMVPGLYVDGYWRTLSTLIFVGLAIIVARAVVAALLTFRRIPDPPEKPLGALWPKVSILVPAYNEASVLPRSMASMRHIDYPKDRLEFVYVYEGKSNDGTGAVIASSAKGDPRFIVLERRNARPGKSAAFNDALAHCTGDIIIGLDADQALRPDAVRRAVQWFLADPKVACIKARPIGVNHAESALALVTKLERDAIERGDIFMRELVGGFTFFGGGQVFFRRSVFEELGGYDEEMLVEDIDYAVKIHRAGHRLMVDPKIITYEEHPAYLSAWWGQRSRWARGWMQVAKRYLARSLSMPALGWSQRADLAGTLAYVLVPTVFLLLTPLSLVNLAGGETRTYFPAELETAGWVAFALSPVLCWLAMWLQDKRDGVRHEAREWLALPFLWAYMVFQSAVFASAFLDEFVLRKPNVFVKTAKTGQLVRPARATGDPLLADE